MGKKLVIFNLKMNPSSLREARKLADFTQNYAEKFGGKAEIVIAPPFVYIPALKIINRKLKIGAQNAFWANEGAYTGEISPEMLKGLGVEYVIIGHSERRKYLCETDEMINEKVSTALKAGLKVILCVGEQKRELRSKNYELRKAQNYVRDQLQKDLKGVLNLKSYFLNLIIAYEPVWAIGTGKACKPEDALEMARFIKKILDSRFSILDSRVLYGGSVNGNNVVDFIKYKDIDGVLVGGASLKPKEVLEIIKKAG